MFYKSARKTVSEGFPQPPHPQTHTHTRTFDDVANCTETDCFLEDTGVEIVSLIMSYSITLKQSKGIQKN